MSCLPLIAWALLGFSDPARLVAQLGSPRYAEREAAGAALRTLGRDALSALREALTNPDAEIRTRATGLLQELETRLLIEPTQVRLAFDDLPLAEVLRQLGEQANVQLSLVGDVTPQIQQRRVTLVADGPATFWEAIERLCREAQLQVTSGMFPQNLVAAQARAVTVQLCPNTVGAIPTSLSGPFRVAVATIDHSRHRSFLPGMFQQPPFAAPGNPFVLPRHTRPGEPPRAATGAVPGLASEQFVISLQVLAEPRLSVIQNGSLKLDEAIDENGRSLVGTNEPGRMQQFGALNAYNAVGGSQLHLPIPLTLPELPGKSVKRLRGALPVAVLSRKDNPFVVSLTDAKGKTFEGPGLTLQVHDVRNEPGQPFTSIDMTVKVRRDGDNDVPGPYGQEFMVFRNNPGQGQNQIEILDPQGRAYTQWFPFNNQPTNDGLRLTLRLMPAEGLGPPAQIRYYEMARAETEIRFDLNDIPMP
jgi:hypothetical protein